MEIALVGPRNRVQRDKGTRDKDQSSHSQWVAVEAWHVVATGCLGLCKLLKRPSWDAGVWCGMGGLQVVCMHT